MSIQNNEKLAIKAYCTIARQIETAKQQFQQGIKQHKLEADTHRVNLLQMMQANNISCIPFENGYARIKVNNSMRAVTKEVLVDALQLLTRELVEAEKKEHPNDPLVYAILKLIQSRRTKTKEYVEFCKYKPKTFQPSPINERVSETCARWRTAKKQVEEVKKIQKDATKDLIEQQKSCELLVKQFMDRADLTTQRVNINERTGKTQTYFIKNKVSTTKPRVTKKIIETSLRNALQQIGSVEEVLQHKVRLASVIFDELANRPAKSKKSVKLVKGMSNEKKI